MSHLERRTFLKQLGAAGTVAGLGSFALSASAAPIAPLKIGLSQYSLRQLFFQKKLSVYDYPDFAKETFGITDIDVWEGGFMGEEKKPDFFKQLKARADKAGSNIFLYMAGVVQAQHEDSAKRTEAAKAFFTPVDRAAKLDCQYLRVFLRAPDGDEDRALTQSVSALKPIADYAGEKKIKVVIEPGASKQTQHGSFLIKVAERMKHPYLKLMPDFGKFKGGTAEEGTLAMMPQTEVVSAKSHNFDAEGRETGFNYHKLMEIIFKNGFEGLIA